MIFLRSQSTKKEQSIDYELSNITEHEFCFLTAVSSNHLHGANAFILSIQKFYPCAKVFIYDLGLSKKERKALQRLPYVEEVMKLVLPVRGKDYFPLGSCAFKPPMILQFIDKYLNNETNCRYFFYGDSVIYFRRKFTKRAFDEASRLGIVVQAPQAYSQIQMTHPGMFKYFGFDREKLFRDERKARGNGIMRQVQAGLMLVDASNTTMRNTFFKEWADCAANDDCLLPGKVRINKFPPQRPLAIHNISGIRVFKAHRDDQSAFTFLLARYFGYNRKCIQRVHLNAYVNAYWRQRASLEQLKVIGVNCTKKNFTTPNISAAGKKEVQ